MILRNFNVYRDESDPAEIQRLKNEGFEEVYEEKAIDFAGMSKTELVVMADAQGVKNAKKMSKAELVKVLEGK